MSSADKVILKVKRKNKTLVQLQLVITSKVSKSLAPIRSGQNVGPVLSDVYQMSSAESHVNV